jgi:hypothetical protein
MTFGTRRGRRRRLAHAAAALVISLASGAAGEAGEDLTCSADRGYHRVNHRPLRPADLPPIVLYQDWENSTVQVSHSDPDVWQPPQYLKVSSGSIGQAGQGNFESKFHLLSGVVSPQEIDSMLTLIDADWLQSTLDKDPDSVDGIATQEFFIDVPPPLFSFID